MILTIYGGSNMSKGESMAKEKGEKKMPKPCGKDGCGGKKAPKKGK